VHLRRRAGHGADPGGLRPARPLPGRASALARGPRRALGAGRPLTPAPEEREPADGADLGPVDEPAAPAAEPRSVLTPTGEGERLHALDAIRGVAILGIVPANLPAFALPAAAEDRVHYVAGGAGEEVAFFVLNALVDFKFITIFSILFGAGIALQAERADASGREFFGFYAWRLVLLAGIGLLHVVLLWYGDILFHYAAVGVVAMLAVRLAPRWQALAAAGLVLVPVLIFAAFAGLFAAQPGLTAGATAGPETLSAAVAEVEAGEAAAGLAGLGHPGRETLLFREGPYLEQVVWRLGSWLVLLFTVLIIFSWRLLGCFLIGMALLRARVFHDPGAHRGLLWALVGVGALIGLPGEAARAAWLLEDPAYGARMALEATQQLSSLALALGYVALVLLLPAAWSARGPLRPFAAVGRTALTCYLLESVIGVGLFYSFGLGWFGRLTRLELGGAALAIMAALPPLALLWLRCFRLGPVEWAWRSAAYGKLQPLRRRSTGPA